MSWASGESGPAPEGLLVAVRGPRLPARPGRSPRLGRQLRAPHAAPWAAVARPTARGTWASAVRLLAGKD